MWSVRETVTSPCPLGGVPSVRHEFRDRRCQTALHLGLSCRGFLRTHTFCGGGDAPPQFRPSFSPGRGLSAIRSGESPDLRAEPARVPLAGYEDPLGCFASERPRKMGRQPHA
nr:uncharacterized protein LOC129528432 [Gorilla gorilla gorilla]